LHEGKPVSKMKAFNVHDGHGMRMLQDSGVMLAIITSRKSGCVEARARNLGIDLRGSRILLMGAGGAAQGVLGALLEAGVAGLTIANRNEDKARELFGKLDQARTREDFLAALAFLEKRPECTGKVGTVGFCYGGGMVNFLATRAPELAAGVPFYGGQPPAEDVARIKAPLLIHYAEKDDRINAGIPAFEQALKANKLYQMLDGKQRELALIAEMPAEADVPFQGREGRFPGIPIADLTADQKEHAQDVLKSLLEPYRLSDREEASKCLEKQGGLDKCSLAFYKQGDIGDLRTAYNVLTEARTTQAEALADSGMSTTEYQYLVGQVYKSMWATEVAKSTGGKSVSEATGSAFDTMAEAMKASGSTSPEAQKAIAQMKAQAAQTQESAKQLDVPQANIDLFRKHEAEIKRYAMGGLELLGL